MQSRFIFLESLYPKLAEYGEKAEHALGKDNNICLLNLGRIAETITETLCRRNNISIDDTSKAPDKLFEAGIIDENICLKINTLTEIKEDAANHNYSSETAATRLITTAIELCEWFTSDKGISRFAFLGDLFPDNAPFPTLAVLAEYGFEAEENLFTNTRYCLLCLGDIEEAVVDILLNEDSARPHYELDQDQRINMLYKVVGMDNRDKLDILHKIRQIRNDAVHSRYDSESDTMQTLDDTLKLCEWLFMFMVSPNDFIRGIITEITPEGLSVSTGKITGFVPVQEVPPDSADLNASFRTGERKIFRVISKDENGSITLSLIQGLTDPWANMARRYEKYSVGQAVNVRVKRTADNFGALVDVNDGGQELQARIPRAEYGSWANPVRAKDAMKTGDVLRACVIWVNPEHYPYMLMSIAEAEKSKPVETPPVTPELPESAAMPDNEFRVFCRKAKHLEIVRALDSGANAKAVDAHGTTALMEAAKNNPDAMAVRDLLKAGADVNAVNEDGNTALIFAAAQNSPEVVRLLCEHGADTGILNNNNQNALDHARENPKLNNDAGILQLLAGDDEEPPETPEAPVQPEPVQPQPEAVSDNDFLNICRFMSDNDIIEAIENGANVNAADHHGTTALMQTARRSTSGQAVKKLIEKGADVNAANNGGVTALLMAVMNTRRANIEILLDNDADVLAANNQGNSVLYYAQQQMTGQHYHDLLQRIENAAAEAQAIRDAVAMRETLQRDILRICRAGSIQEISQAIMAGVNLNVRSQNGDTPLVFAAKENSAEAVKKLINAGARVNTQDNAGNTALIYAAAYNNPEVVRVLLDNGADKDIQNNEGHRAYDYARKNRRLNHTDVLERLR